MLGTVLEVLRRKEIMSVRADMKEVQTRKTTGKIHTTRAGFLKR